MHPCILFYRNNQVPQPFSAIPPAHEISYLNDLLVYDTVHMAWHGVRGKGLKRQRDAYGNNAFENRRQRISAEQKEKEDAENNEDDDDDDDDGLLEPEGRYGKY